MSDKSEACPVCGMPIRADVDDIEELKTETSQQQNGIISSGANQSVSDPVQSETKKPKEKKTWLMIGIGAGCAVLIVFALWLLVFKDDQKSVRPVEAVQTIPRIVPEQIESMPADPSRESSINEGTQVNRTKYVVIDGSELRLRLGPSTSSDTFKWGDGSNRHPVVGEKFRYLDEYGDFYKIDFKGHELWVSKLYTHLE